MGTREQIVTAADRLFYEQGFGHTSFASIAEAVGISRGNFYYHFRTKDEILAAVLESRRSSTLEMLDAWSEEAADPRDRIVRFVEIVVTNQHDIELYGCPVGTLTGELAKVGHPARAEAVAIFELFRGWLRAQLAELGFESPEADDLALHLLTLSQGMATMSNAFGDRAHVRREVSRIGEWLADQHPTEPA